MYTRRKQEINHDFAAYFTDILIHYGFGERVRVFHAFSEKLLRLIAADLTVVAQNIEHCCCVVMDTLLRFLKC